MDKVNSNLGLSISLIAGGAGIIVMLSLPLTYFFLGYQEEAATAQTKATLYASLTSTGAASRKSGSQPLTKQEQLNQLTDILGTGPRDGGQESFRILDMNNNPIAETHMVLSEPLVTRIAEIKDSEEPFARIEITRSLRPMLTNTMLLGLLGMLLGSAIFFLLRIFPMRSFRLASNEINARKIIESDLQESVSILGATLESTADGILVMGHLGRITSFNDQFVKMWQIPAPIIDSRDNLQFLSEITKQLRNPKHFLDKISQLRNAPLEGNHDGQEKIELIDGRAFELTSKSLWVEGKSAGWVWSFHDITERERAEEILNGEKLVLEGIVNGEDVPEILKILAHSIEEQSGKMLCTILVADEHEKLRPAGSYNISKDFLAEAEQLIVPASALARSNVPRQESMPDVSTEPVWADYRGLALRHGLHVRWAVPIYSKTSDSVLGLVAIYYRDQDVPDPHDLRLLEIATHLASIVMAREQAEAHLQFLAHYDSLTHLPNRALFRDRLTSAVARADRSKQMFALMFIDLDHFKTINDTLGHDIGDLLLKQAAERITVCMREGDTTARLGGDEFTVILEQITEPEDAGIVAQKIIDKFTPPFSLNGNEAFITPSIGISIYPLDSTDIDALLKNTDTAMYIAKESGRNNYQFYTKQMNIATLGRLDMENSLRHAVERNEFIIYYQPKISLDTGLTVGMEALLRWAHPQRGIVSPQEFIPLLEDTGLINQVGDWLIHTACIQNKVWMDAGFPQLRVAVNLSARQFQHNSDILQNISSALHDSGLDGNYLELEVTESLLMQNPDKITEILNKIKALGVMRIDIDDFGTGYSSLSNLKRFPINTVKIDQSFVQGMPNNEEDIAIVTAVIGMAKNLNLKVIAEGVENEQQLALLRNLGCNEVQGFIFSRPLPAEGFAKWLRQGNVMDRIEAACEKYKPNSKDTLQT